MTSNAHQVTANGFSADGYQNSVEIGSKNADKWVVSMNFNWAKIRMVRISCLFNGVRSGGFWVDTIYSGGKRYSNITENAGYKVHVELPNENIDRDFRVISAKYSIDGQT
jgi:hypothetical protein